MNFKRTTKSISLLLATISLVGILCGCGSSSNEITFRGIPFGTKASDALLAINLDLKEQGYSKEPTYNSFDTGLSVYYFDIMLYDYEANMFIEFNKDKEEKDGDATLAQCSYSIHCDSPEKTEACYKFFYNKLKSKYGKSTVGGLNVRGDAFLKSDRWQNGDIVCDITTLKNNVWIIYGYKDDINVFGDAPTEGQKASDRGL